MSSMDPQKEMLPEEFVRIATALEKRLCDDPIVSDDIKQLAACVRVLAESTQDILETLAEVANRPAGFTVNYGK